MDFPPKKVEKTSLFQVKLIKTAGDKFHKNLNNPKILNLLLQYVIVEKSKEEEKARTNNQTRVETFAVFPLANCRRMLPIFPRTEFIGVRCKCWDKPAEEAEIIGKGSKPNSYLIKSKRSDAIVSFPPA